MSESADLPLIELVTPMPGFPELTRFALVELDEDGTLCSLSSVEENGVRFLVLPPTRFFPDYAPVLDDQTADELALTSPEEALVLVVVNPGESLDSTTVNLLAPVVVNIATRRAAQVILDDPALSLATPLLAG